MRLSVIATLVATALVVTACSSSDGTKAPAASSASIELQPNAKVLDEATLALLSDAASDLSTLTFKSSNASLDALVAGDVIMGGISAKTPNGLLRKVRNVVKSSGGVAVTTDLATLRDAIRRGKIVMPRTPLVKPTARAEEAPGTKTQTIHVLDTGADNLSRDFTIGIDDISLAPGVKAGASLGFGLAADLSLDIDVDKIEGKVVLSGSEAASVNVGALVSAEVDKRQTLGAYYFPPIPITIGPVPVVITTSLTVDVGVRGRAGAAVTWSAKEDAKVDIGLELSTEKGVHPVFAGKANGEIDPVTAAGEASLEAGAGLTLEVAINAPIASASLKVGCDGYVKVETFTSGPACYKASVGVDGRVGVDVSILGWTIAEPSTSKKLYGEPINEGACAADPTASTGWATVIAPSDLERTPSMDLLADGSLLVGSNSSGVVGYAARVATRAAPIWERKIDGTASVARIVGLADGGAWIVGKHGVPPAIAKVDATGARTMMKDLDWDTSGAGVSTVTAAKAKDGGLWLGGSALDGSAFVPWAAKIDASGNVVWAKTYGLKAEPHAIVETNDGGAVLVGEENTGPSARAFVMRVSPAGDATFTRLYAEGRLYGVTALKSGGVATVGQIATGTGAIVIALQDDGNQRWGFSYEDPVSTVLDFRGNAVAERSDGILVAGRRDFGDAADAWAMSVANDGTLGFSRSYGGSAADEFFDARVGEGDSAYLIGETKSFGGTSSILLARTTPTGVLAFASGSNATQKNVDGVKKALPGTGATLTATPKTFALTSHDASKPDWEFQTMVAPQKSLAP